MADQPRKIIESSCLFTNQDGTPPMYNLQTSPSDFLDDIQDRSQCSLCCKSRRYFCYTCCVPLDSIKDKIPRVTLPVDIDIIKHPLEVDGKSTAIHAAVLSPDHVKIYMYPNIPDYTNMKVAMVFPAAHAVTLKELWNSAECNKQQRVPCHCVVEDSQKNCENIDVNCAHQQLPIHSHQKLPFDRIVFIDSTWRQTRKIYMDARLRDLPNITLPSHKSLFWRHQRNKPMSYLSTIEAIYYFLRELDTLLHPERSYCGQYDNILFFFKYMYQKIRCVYDPRISQLLAEGSLRQANTS